MDGWMDTTARLCHLPQLNSTARTGGDRQEERMREQDARQGVGVLCSAAVHGDGDGDDDDDDGR